MPDINDLLDQIEDMNEAGDEIRWRHKKEIKELIAEFLERLDYLRDFVLEAPILTRDILEIKEYIHTIKDEIKKERNIWEKKKGELEN